MKHRNAEVRAAAAALVAAYDRYAESMLTDGQDALGFTEWLDMQARQIAAERAQREGLDSLYRR